MAMNNDGNFKKDEKGRCKCETYSRVVGYLSNVSNWNEGKQEEWQDRVVYQS